MKAQNARLILGAGIISVAALAFCGMAAAQAPAGPVSAPPQPAGAPPVKPRELPPPPPPRQSILGAWVLNRDESDDPRKRMRDSQDSGGGYGGRREAWAGRVVVVAATEVGEPEWGAGRAMKNARKCARS